MLYDAVVVGGGVMGSSTTYHLSKRRRDVLLLDQFPLNPCSENKETKTNHDEGKIGSSGGKSRVYRNVHADELHARMAMESIKMWRQLEKESGIDILVECGCLSFAAGVEKSGGGGGGEVEEEEIQSAIEESASILTSLGVPAESLKDAASLGHRFPQMNFFNGEVGVLDVTAGVVKVEAALEAFRRVALENGADIRGGETVVGVWGEEEDGDGELADDSDARIVVVKTNTGASYRCRRLILTPGPWAAPLLRHVGVELPLKTLRIRVCYWAETQIGAHDAGGFPAWGDANAGEGRACIYGLPALEYPGHVKVCLHSGVEAEPPSPADHKGHGEDILDMNRQPTSSQNTSTIDAVNDKTEAVDEDVEILREFVKRRFPLLDSTAPSIVETCWYTMTPDWDFVIGRTDAPKKHMTPIGDNGVRNDGDAFSGLDDACNQSNVIGDTKAPIKQKKNAADGYHVGDGDGSGNVIFAVGFSGMGFKMAPVVGEILADVAEDKRTKFDLGKFDPNRFDQ